MMMAYRYSVAFYTILAKEVRRFARIWLQTLLPPLITMTLYFVIFGHLIGSQIRHIEGFSYMQYLVPGLVMMSVVTNAYSNVVSSFYMTRFQRVIEDLVIAPVPHSLLLLGYTAGGVIRGVIIGLLVTGIGLIFTHLPIHNWLLSMAIFVLSAVLFALAGFTNGLLARNFDDISIVPTFVLTPLTYLGGVFYSIHDLPPFWQKISLLNPLLYMINAFRDGILGISDVNVYLAFAIIIIAIIILFVWNLSLLRRGVGIKT